jgi:hypothetical protein
MPSTKVLMTVPCFLLLLLTGCQKTIKPCHLSKLKIGMSKHEVIEQIGEPSVQRGSMINNFAQEIDVYEYLVDHGATAQQYAACTLACICSFGLLFPLYFCLPGHLDPYWLFFCDNRLEKWCKAGDWETTQHNIQEIRFR